MNWEIIDDNTQQAKIKVIGVGGAGGNAVIHMMNHNIEGVEFYARIQILRRYQMQKAQQF